MSTINSKVGSKGSMRADIKRTAQKAEFSPLMEALTRLGYAVRGVIYITIGLLAVQVALGRGGALASPQGAIAAIGKQPAGLILLWVVLVGLVSYALWGVVRAVLDPLHKGHDLKGLLARGGFLASAFGYAILVLPTYRYITGASQRAGGSQTQKFFTSIMAMPWGRWAIGILGLAVLAGGLYQVYLGFKAGFDRQFKIYALTAKEVKLAVDVARFGTAARGVVLAFVGGLIILSAYQANPGQPVGMDTALATLLHQPYGIWLLGIVAVGLVAFGAYSILSAAWFRLKR
ncbi:MAG TPA: DUF1206 domain-containing protein [Anaerolineales bacterium]|nr:DUF1206 domain-containing protein [Anaerolineales bacterium]HLO32208.1 DUF1206 domain-containing protein [Anaerolineales bacterium]